MKLFFAIIVLFSLNSGYTQNQITGRYDCSSTICCWSYIVTHKSQLELLKDNVFIYCTKIEDTRLTEDKFCDQYIGTWSRKNDTVFLTPEKARIDSLGIIIAVVANNEIVVNFNRKGGDSSSQCLKKDKWIVFFNVFPYIFISKNEKIACIM